VRPVFEEAFCEFGLPLAIRSDNGPPFASTATGGLSTLSLWWLKGVSGILCAGNPWVTLRRGPHDAYQARTS
jgi:hypothetical protein